MRVHLVRGVVIAARRLAQLVWLRRDGGGGGDGGLVSSALLLFLLLLLRALLRFLALLLESPPLLLGQLLRWSIGGARARGAGLGRTTRAREGPWAQLWHVDLAEVHDEACRGSVLVLVLPLLRVGVI